jgi:excisionase family DNA binding protein
VSKKGCTPNDPEVVGTGEIAKILHVSSKTAAKLIDRGTIPGWVVPGSSHRRALRKAVMELAHKMGVAQDIEVPVQTVLTLEEVAKALSKPLPLIKRWVASGSIPTVLKNRRKVVYQDALLDYANSHNIRLRLE